MRILYVITRADLGGAQMHVLKLLNGLAGREDTALACGEEGILTARARNLAVPVFPVPDLIRPVSPRRDFLAFRQLRHVIRAWKPDVVHCHSSKAGVVGRLAARAENTACVFTAHGWAFADGAGLGRKLLSVPCEQLAGRTGAHVIVASNYERELGLRHRAIAADRLHVIYEGAEDLPARAQPGTLGTPNLIMVARFSRQKDHRTLLRAAAGIEQPFNLWLVGEGPLCEAMRVEAEKLGAANRVRFLGSRTDVPELLAKAHVFVLASRYEGIPMSVLEAMRASLPVVATGVGGMHECVKDGKTGFLVARGNAEAMRSKLQLLIGNPNLREQFGKASRHLYENRFLISAGQIVRQTVRVYEQAAASMHTAPTGARQAPSAPPGEL